MHLFDREDWRRPPSRTPSLPHHMTNVHLVHIHTGPPSTSHPCNKCWAMRFAQCYGSDTRLFFNPVLCSQAYECDNAFRAWIPNQCRPVNFIRLNDNNISTLAYFWRLSTILILRALPFVCMYVNDCFPFQVSFLFILQPEPPPHVVAFEPWTIAAPFCFEIACPHHSIPPVPVLNWSKCLKTCVILCFFPFDALAFLIEINFSFASLFAI